MFPIPSRERVAARVNNDQGCTSSACHCTERGGKFRRIQNGNASTPHPSVRRMQDAAHCQRWLAMQKDDKRPVFSVDDVFGKR